MKKILFAASLIALVATGCKDGNTTKETATTSNEAASVSAAVAYVQIDSLITKYDMYEELRTAYEEKAKKADTELTSKGRALERDVMDYQDKVQKGLVTRAQAQTLEEGLNKKQQTFVQQREKVMAEMGEEERVMLNQIQYSITEYLKEFNADGRFGIIMSTSGGTPILNGDPKLDLTKEVLSGLNKKYADTKTKSAK